MGGGKQKVACVKIYSLNGNIIVISKYHDLQNMQMNAQLLLL